MIIQPKGVFFLVVGVILFQLPAQALKACGETDQLSFKEFTIREGLSNDNIEAIYQDAFGFLWFGTRDGLNRYDGYHIKNYTNEYGLSNNAISCILEDNDSTLWVGTDNGMNRYMRDEDRFVPYLKNVDPDKPQIKIVDILDFTRDRLLIFTEESGVFIMDKHDEHLIKLSHNPQDPNTISSSKIKTAFLDRHQNIWVGTKDNGVDCFNEEFVKKWHQSDLLQSNGKSASHTSAIIDLKDDRYWIGTHGHGIFEVDEKGTVLHQYTTENSALKSNVIWNFFKDDEEHIWVSTQDGGVTRYCFHNRQFITYMHNESKPNSINSDIIRTIFQDASGSIWIGTYNGGINYIDRSMKKFEMNNRQVPRLFDMKNEHVISTFHDNEGHLWVGTDGDGIYRYHKETQSARLFSSRNVSTQYGNIDKVLCIGQDSSGTIWMGCYEGGLVAYNPSTDEFSSYLPGWVNQQVDLSIWDLNIDHQRQKIWLGSMNYGLLSFDMKERNFNTYEHYGKSPHSHFIWCIEPDNQDNLWIGSSDGLYRYRFSDSTFVSYTHDPADPYSLSNNWVISIYIDALGHVWIGTHGGGLNSYDPEMDGFYHITKKQHLTSNVIYDILEDSNRHLWLATSNGINRMRVSDTLVHSYNITDGLAAKQFNVNSASKNSHGWMYFGSNNGLIYFNPHDIKHNQFIPPIVITDFQLFNEPVKISPDGPLKKNITTTDTLVLSYRQNIFSIEFAALNYSNPQENQYAYYLEDFEEKWNYVGHKRIATYTNLNPGTYYFHVKGSNNDNIWNNAGKTLTIIITPPYWKTLWFRGIMIILTFVLIWFIYRLRTQALLIKQKRLKSLVNKQTTNLTEANSLLQKRQQKILRQNEEIQAKNKELQNHRENLEKLVEKRTKELEKALRKAEESDKLKSAFLANMSHEIRTPMNAILGFSDLLTSEEEFNSLEKELFIKQIKTNGELLLKLLNDLIDISKIESHVVQVASHKCDIKDILFQLYTTHKQQLVDDRNLTLSLAIADHVPAIVYSDEIRLKQIISNLIENAVKYTESGEIRISCYVQDNHIFISVKDTGIGIAAENLPYVFDRFTTLHDNTKKVYRGAGLGLSISKQLATLMGGDITVVSEKDKGSEFTLILPHQAAVQPADSSSKIASPTHQNINNWKGKTVLIVEDEESNFKYLRFALEKTQMNILWAQNGAQAMDIINSNHGIDMVLLDIKLPDYDGFQLLEMIRAKNSRIPIIAQTAFAMSEDEQKIREAGFNDFLAKPIHTSLLIKKIASFMPS